MHGFRLVSVCAFAGACNLASLHAAPLPTNVAAMKSIAGSNSIQVQWRGWRGGGWGYRGFGGWGHRGLGWGLGAGALAGALIGGAIASSAYGYYGGPYYPGPYYPAYVGTYYYGPYYYGPAIQEPAAFGFRRYGPWWGYQ